MAKEIEAKLRLTQDELNTVLVRLNRWDLALAGAHREINTMFDSKGKLEKKGKSLRIRTSYDLIAERRSQQTNAHHTMTYKGPQIPNERYKARPEHEVKVSSAEEAKHILEGLGYAQSFVYEKARYSFHYAMCTIELDELPYIGVFLEVEGLNSAAIERVCEALDLQDKKPIKKGYPTLIENELYDRGMPVSTARFPLNDWRLKKVMEPFIAKKTVHDLGVE